MNRIDALETELDYALEKLISITLKTWQQSYYCKIHQLSEQQKDLHKQGKHLLWLFQSHQYIFLCSRATDLCNHVFAWSFQPFFLKNSRKHCRIIRCKDNMKMNGNTLNKRIGFNSMIAHAKTRWNSKKSDDW